NSKSTVKIEIRELNP
ncbi:unnamed protein product, partial [Oikopleura dioica]